MSRRTKARCAVALGTATILAAGLGACSLIDRPSEPEALVDKFTEALDSRDVAGAASLTSYPNAATATIQQMFDGLHPQSLDYKVSQFIGLDDQSGFFTLNAAWHFGENKDWSYDVQGSVRKLAIGWRISWDPSVVMPGLGHGSTVQLVRTDAPPPRVLDATGNVMMAEQTINAITLDPARMPDPATSTAAVSKAIEPVAPLITGQSLMQQLVVARGKPITAVSLRDDDFAILGPELESIPGVVVEKQPRLITTDRRIDSPILDGLRNAWQANRDATAGWSVQMTQPNGAPPRQMAGYQGPPGPDIASTLDPKLQLAAEDAAVSVATPSAVVAIQPSTGAVLAAAQDNQADEIGPIAFTGQYPIGSNADLLKAAAAVEKGTTPDKVSASDIAAEGEKLGVGVDYKIPGFNEVTGAVPGGGKGLTATHNNSPMTVSPFGLAMLAASIARGGTAVPMIEKGRPASTDAPLGPLRADVTQRLRAMLRDGLSAPESEPVRDYQDVIGVSSASGKDRWFVGIRGDLAFAVYVKDADSRDQAAKVVTRMFRSLAHPSA
ncbi:penicillin-binding protein [Skermania sp. ID1734]|uniref:NTF2-like N-terminal transpeptidase domain-containing protein n=1 Tax=Skermania sp. ID1734 TaxID=2597516 RepID=UPI00117E13A1|nr:NTF2-like N-terminal transpeptidase domain-containing protein [Skermania sp. ID1734]TSE00478.1 penicillin-binding protein [Skermania sp. ID1734]